MSNAAQGQEPAVSQEPGAQNPEIVALEARLMKQFDDRAKGFQRALAEKDQEIAQYRAKLAEQELAGLAPEERTARALQKLQEENAQLRAQQELVQLASEYGDDTIGLYRSLLGAGSAKDQLELLKGFSGKPATAPAEETEGDEEIPDVDMNNPVRPPISGDVMNDAVADRILGSVGRQAQVTQSGRSGYGQAGGIS